LKYQKGDKIVVTRNKEFFATPFSSITLKKGYILTIIERSLEENVYNVSINKSTFLVQSNRLEEVTELENQLDKKYSKVIETGLTFGQAIDRALREGEKITREIWGGYWCVQKIRGLADFNSPTWKGHFLVATLKDGGHAMATPYQEDMFATDWMVVE
jgi:Protein of unknown function (DUF2829)